METVLESVISNKVMTDTDFATITFRRRQLVDMDSNRYHVYKPDGERMTVEARTAAEAFKASGLDQALKIIRDTQLGHELLDKTIFQNPEAHLAMGQTGNGNSNGSRHFLPSDAEITSHVENFVPLTPGGMSRQGVHESQVNLSAAGSVQTAGFVQGQGVASVQVNAQSAEFSSGIQSTPMASTGVAGSADVSVNMTNNGQSSFSANIRPGAHPPSDAAVRGSASVHIQAMGGKGNPIAPQPGTTVQVSAADGTSRKRNRIEQIIEETLMNEKSQSAQPQATENTDTAQLSDDDVKKLLGN